ncbi:MAG TPA: rod shape-determining protein MreC [Candidatus Limnocylindrales bacterium]|nr:rod shape-determining protein MreC [Candidatus Limnocylindrales bacterium]
MALFDSRQRAGYLFVGVTLAHILLISAQVNSPTGVPILQMIVFGAFAEVQRGISAGISGVERVWGGYVGLRDARSENAVLKRRLEAAEVALQEQRALADRTRNLERLLDLRDRSALRTTAAEIIAAGASPDFRTLTIDRGTRDGVQADMAVIAPSGVVGRIVVPSARAAKVQLLIDRNAAAGALIERSRAHGVVVGRGDERLLMEYVAEAADVVVGDLVVASGIEGIYPKGYAIGRVDGVEKSGPSYKRIRVKPAVDFSSLEEVLVVLTPTPARRVEERVE